MAHTRYSHLSLKELLNIVDSKRQHSPIIDELCNRIENFKEQDTETEGDLIQLKNTIEETTHTANCPVCDAQLKMKFSIEGENEEIIKATILI